LILRQQQLPVKVIVFKNDSLAFVELEMKAAGILDFGTAFHNPDFAKIAEGAGLLGLSAATADDVYPMLQQALNFDGPALVQVPVPRQGTVDAPDNHVRAGERIQPVLASSRPERARRRGSGSG
jgi:pyruvate dehydrogenase (quinone)